MRKATGRGVPIVTIALLAGVWLSAQDSPRLRASSPEAVLEQVRGYLGVSPMECGRHGVSREPSDNYLEAVTSSVHCVTTAATARRPSWMLLQVQGIDSWVAIGLVSNREGMVLRFLYDSDPSGGSGAAPRMPLRPCDAPAVSRRDRFIDIESRAPAAERQPAASRSSGHGGIGLLRVRLSGQSLAPVAPMRVSH